jgi:hypothetical protein
MTMSELMRKNRLRFDALYFRTRERDAYSERLKQAIRVTAQVELQKTEITRLTQQRDALQQRIEWTQREYLKGDYTAMALNLFDGTMDDGMILRAEAMTDAAAPAVDAAPVGITDEAFAAVMHNLDTMTARQSLSHASLAKDYAADHVDVGNPLDAVPQLINAVGHIIDALTTMQKEKAQS